MATRRRSPVPFRFHPRAFAALGADLVTNDIVAIIELVKNSYDAFATEVHITFSSDESGEYLEIVDDGVGMTEAIIKDAWCVVATPYRLKHVHTKRGHKSRRVAGAKGLGRLSAARLGNKLELTTKARRGKCWSVVVDWELFSRQKSIDKCTVDIETASPSSIEGTGTRLRIRRLRSEWSDQSVEDLQENLARFVSPFKAARDFSIWLTPPGGTEQATKITPGTFLRHPKYSIKGRATAAGDVKWSYRYRSIGGTEERPKSGSLKWSRIAEASPDKDIKKLDSPECGPFDFEIRAWDIATGDTREISDHYKIKRSLVRTKLRAYKGISVYRDGVLVLPKSESTRDWLGLDLRRVGRVGPRLSTPQIVGYVSISADKNPRLVDTSDREGLMSNMAVSAFQELLRSIVFVLETERDRDRRGPEDEKSTKTLFDEISAEELVRDLETIAKEEGAISDALPVVRMFSDRLRESRTRLETRFTYYSRLATVGTIAQMLVHEVRNRATVIASSLAALEKQVGDALTPRSARRLELAGSAVASLERLAETFAPLASRAFKRRKRSSILEASISRCTELVAGEVRSRNVSVEMPEISRETVVAVDPGELDAIILNLITNALYWLGSVEGERVLQFETRKFAGGKRVRVWIHDSGPGVAEDDADQVFWPGVTRKPDGIGMGLTVASELIAAYNGEMRLEQPGKLGGATFAFDVPLK